MTEKIEECDKEEKVKYQSHKTFESLSQNKWINKLTKKPQVGYVPFEYMRRQEHVC